jgi:hypothetical protein
MPELDAQALLKEIMPAVQSGLEQGESFVPLGAVIALDGSVRSVPIDYAGYVDGTMPAQEVVAAVRERLRLEARTGKVRSAAMAADVRIWRRKDGDEASNAVSVHVEHQDGYCVDLLIPYKVRKGMMSRLRKKPQVMFRKMIAQEAAAVIFPLIESPALESSIDLQAKQN